MERFNYTVIFSIVAVFFVLAVLFTPINDSNSIGFAFSTAYPGYAASFSYGSVNTTLVFNSATDTITRSVDVSDDIVYRTGYVSYDGTSWTPFDISTGGAGNLNVDWISTKGTVSLSFTPTQLGLNTNKLFSNNTYIIIYSCSKNTTAKNWSCHDGWQIMKFDAKLSTGSSGSTFTWTNELMINGGFESGNFNGWTTSNSVWKVGNHLINTQYALPQSGSFCAFVNGSSDSNGFIYQDVNLTIFANSIDSGTAVVNASGWGVSSESPGQDLSRIQIMFLNSVKGIISVATDSTAIDSSIWWQRGVSNFAIPSGTRFIRMWGNTYEQGYSSGSLDSFSVKVGYGGTPVVVPPGCNPACSGKQCGDDGCGGTCGTCTNTHGTTSCSSSGLCQPVCASNYASCDSNNVNGCETQLGTITNCASCGNSCGNNQVCNGVVCATSGTLSCTGSASISCTSSIPYSATATQTRTCNTATGTWNNDGTCTLISCVSGYHTLGNTCLQDTVVTPPTNLITYYIDSTTGVDSSNRDGSSTSPWKSLAYACSRVATSGSLIYVNAGTYAETTHCNLAPGVSIQGAGVTSVIKTSYSAGERDGIILLNSASGNPVNGNQFISYIKLDGNSYAATNAIAVNFRYNVAIHHITITNFDQYSITFANNNRGYPNPPTITYATGNSIHDSNIYNSEISLEGQDGFQIYNNLCNNTGRPSKLYAKCVTSDWMKGFKIYNNVFAKLDINPSWNFFFETWHYSDNSEIYNNTFYGNAAIDLSDVRKGSGSWGLKVYNNKFLVAATTANGNTDSQAIDLEGWGAVQYVYVYNNYFKNTVSGVWLEGYNQANVVPINGKFTMDHIYIYYNVFDNIGCTNKEYVYTITLTDDSASGYANNVVWDNVYIFNNVMKSAASPNQNMNGIRSGIDGAATNFHIDNNIIQGYASNPIYLAAGSNINGISVEQNLYWQNGANSAGYAASPSNKVETTPTPANPSFMSTSDYHLQSTSPAKDKGISMGITSTDYEGTPVPQGSAPDIGAYEWR